MLVVLAAVLLLFTETHSTVCNSGQKLLTEPKGHVSSPNPGQSGTCSWKLDVPEDSRIIFYFKFYDIDHCSDDSYPVTKCTGCTRIELKDSSNEPPWHTFCDYKSELPEPISTNTSTLFVNFVLSPVDSKSWFTAEYETWPSQGKVDLITNARAEISSPLFPGKYPRNSHFQWLVVAPSEYRVKIEFSKFDVRYCSECPDGADCDFLTVRDGASPQSKLLGRYCRSPGSLHTSGNNVWIEFVASMNRGYNSDSTGFKATVSREIKLYVIVVPCVLGILFVSLIAAIVVVTCRRRRLSPSGNGAPVVQMSLLNEDDNLSNTHLPDVGPHNEASLPVYRPTTQKIRR